MDKSAARIRGMFASIAGRYDLLNHVLSLNVDRLWRARAARIVLSELARRPASGGSGTTLLDCCTGTADLALALRRAADGRARRGRGLGSGSEPVRVVGVDFTPELLRIGRRKVVRRGLEGRVSLAVGDALRLPFATDSFAAVTVAFGLRNVSDTARGIDEMIRVARPGGVVAILEFSKPNGAVLGPLYMGFFRKALPRIGQALAPNPDDAYRYLPESVLRFPDGERMLDLMRARGLEAPRQTRMTRGVASLYLGRKPEA